CYQYTSGYTF
nr:immunoglobulin light chain junction region [Macaca mulatta]MOY13359.1 immunoglobulin light chain junction region [Macaca mulatta]MOY14523.1 immunoglobulin light chain junction region [Macaca mulatta]